MRLLLLLAVGRLATVRWLSLVATGIGAAGTSVAAVAAVTAVTAVTVTVTAGASVGARGRARRRRILRAVRTRELRITRVLRVCGATVATGCWRLRTVGVVTVGLAVRGLSLGRRIVPMRGAAARGGRMV